MEWEKTRKNAFHLPKLVGMLVHRLLPSHHCLGLHQSFLQSITLTSPAPTSITTCFLSTGVVDGALSGHSSDGGGSRQRVIKAGVSHMFEFYRFITSGTSPSLSSSSCVEESIKGTTFTVGGESEQEAREKRNRYTCFPPPVQPIGSYLPLKINECASLRRNSARGNPYLRAKPLASAVCLATTTTPTP